jgi:predicted Zn finger-like uncharacterized protein
MNVSCPNCQTKYQIADSKVPAGGAKAKCPNCGQLILITAGGKKGDSSSFFKPSPDVDFGQTIAYDFSEVDQSHTEVTALLEEVSGQEPFLGDGFVLALRDIVTGQEFPLTKPVVTLGRSEGDITLSDPEVSRRHCLIKIFGERFVIEDLKSTNGTYFAGKKVMTAYLGAEERFSVGNTTLGTVVEKRK